MNEANKQGQIRRSLTGLLRRYFLSGLLVWAPVIVTVAVISFIVNLLDGTLLLLPTQFQPDNLFGEHIPGFGVILSIVTLLVTGFLVSNYIGKFLLNLWETLWQRIPLVRSIYTAVKQVMETVVSPKDQAFRQVVLVEWPRREMWTVAFVTTHSKIAAPVGFVNVFVPATPNITSGFLMMVEKSQMKELDISVDEALKLVVSLGVVQPDRSIQATALGADSE